MLVTRYNEHGITFVIFLKPRLIIISICILARMYMEYTGRYQPISDHQLTGLKTVT